MKRDYNGYKPRGITFIEIVISLLLLSIAIGAVIGAFVICRVSVTRVKHRIVAMNLVRAKVEHLKAISFDQVPAQGGAEGVAIDQGISGQRLTAVSDVYSDSKLYRLTVTVSWTELSRLITEQIVTLISRH